MLSFLSYLATELCEVYALYKTHNRSSFYLHFFRECKCAAFTGAFTPYLVAEFQIHVSF